MSQNKEKFRVIFLQAQQAFENKQYRVAKNLFSQSLEYNIKKDMVYFNLGSTLYRLQEFKQATKTFAKVQRSSGLYFLAQYNLSLCYLKRNLDTHATKHANNAFQHATTPKQIKAVNRLSKKFNLPLKQNRWLLSTGLIFGNHQNISIFADDTNLNSKKKDSYLHNLTKLDIVNQQWNIHISHEVFNYRQEDSFDYDASKVALKHLRSNLGLLYNYRRLNQSLFLANWAVDYKTSKNNHKFKPQFTYRFEKFTHSNINYRHLRGHRHQFGMAGIIGNLKMSYQIEHNARLDYRDEQAYKNYSPTVHSFQLASTMGLIGAHFRPSLRYYYSNYGRPNLDAVQGYTRRSDQEFQLALNIYKPLLSGLTWQFTFTAYRHRSNLLEYDYNSSLFNTGLHYSFNK